MPKLARNLHFHGSMIPKRIGCPFTSESGHRVVRTGFFFRTSDSRYVQRFKCKHCCRTFSRATRHPCFGQKKRRYNFRVGQLLAGAVSMREVSRITGLHRTTVARKKRFLGLESKKWLAEFRDSKNISNLQFDDMETFEHTKCKPISISLAVERQTRLILGLQCSSMPPKGRLAEVSLKKYGHRTDERKSGRRQLFSEISHCISEGALIESDMNPHYGPDIRAYFPRAKHITFEGRRARGIGQGELKVGGFDPLFSLNHTCAMFRASVARLIRKTWCTTKKKENLELHLYIYAKSHNLRILENRSGQSPDNPLTTV